MRVTHPCLAAAATVGVLRCQHDSELGAGSGCKTFGPQTFKVRMKPLRASTNAHIPMPRVLDKCDATAYTYDSDANNGGAAAAGVDLLPLY